jgi:hypothetical protein
MSVVNAKSHIITNGASVWVKVSKEGDAAEGDAGVILGLTTNASWQEDFGLQDAVCIGHFGPVSIDPQSYRCSITLGVFIPIAGAMGDNSYDSQIKKGVLEEVKAAEDIFTDGGLQLTFESLAFVNKDSGTTLAKFSGVMLESEGGQVEGNTYARANLTFRALNKEKITW